MIRPAFVVSISALTRVFARYASAFTRYAAAVIAVSVSFPQSVLGQAETDQRFGTVHFATSCNETAQRRFDRAMRYQHSFWYGSRRRCSRRCSRPIPDAPSRIGALR